jgi:hypothetical protein
MKHLVCFGFCLILLDVVSCTSPQDLAPDSDFRAQYEGTYQLDRLSQRGTIGQDTTTSFDGMVQMDIWYEIGDSMLIDPGYEKLPVMAFDERLSVALRESDPGRFVQIEHRSVPGGWVQGGFVGSDSVYLVTEYVHSGTEFMRETLAGRKVE